MEYRKMARTVYRHPQLLTQLPRFYRDRTEITKSHMVAEIKRARNLYGDSQGLELSSMASHMQERSCFGKSYLYGICRRINPEIVVETGVSIGTSSSFILQALEDNKKGHLYSIDLPDQRYDRGGGRLHCTIPALSSCTGTVYA